MKGSDCTKGPICKTEKSNIFFAYIANYVDKH